MRYRRLGRSGLRVSTIALGTATFGATGIFAECGHNDLAAARRQVDKALDVGINLIDTADAYSDGASERIVGQVLEGRRDRMLISTKVGFPVSGEINDRGLSRYHILRAAEASLRRLRADHIDVYTLHEWDGQAPLEETLSALDDLVRAGKVRYLAVSNFAGWQVMKALAVSLAHGWESFVGNQIHYSLESRDTEYELLPLSVDQGLGVLVWSPLAGGLLTGKYRRGHDPEHGRHLTEWNEPPVRDRDRLYAIVDLIVEIAERKEISPSQVALAWLLTRPAVTGLVVGARTEEQLAVSVAAADVVLDEDDLIRLDEISRPPLIYPHWHQRATVPAESRGPADLVLHPYRT
ncbi:aldo/keto reductase [Amycolatopsis japonica]|uniref:aldo/keto reductase n=1 Tax=Amycolatopsis japonica TaxID=208439 RepID=UPI00366A9B86